MMGYKHDYDKTLYRLITILSRLNDGELLSVSDLADEFNVSTRTIQRDLNERLTSFPIEKDGKKWRMKEGFRLERSSSVEDAVVLDILEGFIENKSTLFAKKAKRLLQKLKNGSENQIYTKLGWEDISDRLDQIYLIESAIKSKNIINAHYFKDSFVKDISIKPLKIANYDGFWYLVAIDCKDDKLKKYYLKNLSSIKVSSDKFEVESRIDDMLENALSIWFDENKEPFEVKLHIDSTVVKYFKRKPISKSQKILCEYDDRSIDLSIKITHEMEIIPIIKYWMPHIRVIEPREIKEQIAKDIKTYQQECIEI